MMQETHNCYVLHELDRDGNRLNEPKLTFLRPPDWGHPRWNYHYCKIEIAGEYINHCHIWQEVSRHPVEASKLIAPWLFMSQFPSPPRELCDRSHLDALDFWLGEWGPMPPHYQQEEESVYYAKEPEDSVELVEIGDTLYCWRIWHPEIDAAIIETSKKPLENPPFPTATYLFNLTPNGDGAYIMRDDETATLAGLMFGTHLSQDQELDAEWVQGGWQIQRMPSMTRFK
jgi:hypothetical protein